MDIATQQQHSNDLGLGPSSNIYEDIFKWKIVYQWWEICDLQEINLFNKPLLIQVYYSKAHKVTKSSIFQKFTKLIKRIYTFYVLVKKAITPYYLVFMGVASLLCTVRIVQMKCHFRQLLK